MSKILIRTIPDGTRDAALLVGALALDRALDAAGSRVVSHKRVSTRGPLRPPNATAVYALVAGAGAR